MKIEIKLEDPKSCSGCDFLVWRSKGMDYLSGYGYFCRRFVESDIRYMKYRRGGASIKRPQRCIDENGE